VKLPVADPRREPRVLRSSARSARLRARLRGIRLARLRARRVRAVRGRGPRTTVGRDAHRPHGLRRSVGGRVPRRSVDGRRPRQRRAGVAAVRRRVLRRVRSRPRRPQRRGRLPRRARPALTRHLDTSPRHRRGACGSEPQSQPASCRRSSARQRALRAGVEPVAARIPWPRATRRRCLWLRATKSAGASCRRSSARQRAVLAGVERSPRATVAASHEPPLLVAQSHKVRRWPVRTPPGQSLSASRCAVSSRPATAADRTRSWALLLTPGAFRQRRRDARGSRPHYHRGRRAAAAPRATRGRRRARTAASRDSGRHRRPRRHAPPLQ
jgi:hypothetical protein